MLCLTCGESIENEFRYCPWCGVEVEAEIINVDVVAARIRRFKRYSSFMRKEQRDAAFIISRIYGREEYLRKYSSLEDYGHYELGMKKSMVFMYKDVGECFIDESGDWLIEEGDKWGIAKLYELVYLRKSVSLELINTFIKKGWIHPDLTLQELRDGIKRLRAVIQQMKDEDERED